MVNRRRSTTRDARKAAKRLRDHGEAAKWSFGYLTRWWMKVLPLGVLGILIHFAVSFFLTNDPPDATIFVVLLASLFVILPLAVWLVVAPALYLCIVLAGGVMSREERNH